jgi:hypothetical protein
MPFQFVFPSAEREHRLDQRLEPERGAHLAEEAHRLLARVPERVRGAGGHDNALARTRRRRLPADPQRQRAGEDLEALLLARVDVHGGDGAPRRDLHLDDDQLSLGVRRPSCGT